MHVFYEVHGTMLDTIAREKQIKGAPRRKKLTLIEPMKPTWRDLYPDIL
jgi:predicted GIY-YIG superfamily endonuclease